MSEAALPPRMSLEDFLEWQEGERQEGQELRYELVDNRPVAMAGAQQHDRIVTNALIRIAGKLDGDPYGVAPGVTPPAPPPPSPP
jgi:Uma2 family endonuclease